LNPGGEETAVGVVVNSDELRELVDADSAVE
jgi:hypothetical protein